MISRGKRLQNPWKANSKPAHTDRKLFFKLSTELDESESRRIQHYKMLGKKKSRKDIL